MKLRRTLIQQAVQAALLATPALAWADACPTPATTHHVPQGNDVSDSCRLQAGASIVVDADAALRSGTSTIRVVAGATAGSVENNGIIQTTAGRGIVVDENATLAQGVRNTGSVIARGHGIEAGTAVRGAIDAAADGNALYNSGTITTTSNGWGDESGIRLANGSSIRGNITNAAGGSITGHVRGINLVSSGTRVTGSIINQGDIHGTSQGLYNGSSVDGDVLVQSDGSITGGLAGVLNDRSIGGVVRVDAAASIEGGANAVLNRGTIGGGIDNAGLIRSTANASTAVYNTGDFASLHNSGRIEATGVSIFNAGTITGDLDNTGSITTTATNSIALDNSGTIGGSVRNGGSIGAGSVGIRNSGGIGGSISNTGSLQAGDVGVLNAAGATIDGDIDNSGSIQGATTGLWNAGTINGTLTNTGTIGSGSSALVNEGRIAGGIVSSGLFDGAVTLGDAALTLHDGARISGALNAAGTQVTIDGAFVAEADATIGTLRVAGGRLEIAQALQWNTDQTFIDAAQLRVDGALSGALTLSGESLLEGSGTLGALQMGAGTLSPGGQGQLGTLQVTGDAVLGDGVRYLYDAAADGRSDLLAVSGSARVAGSVMALAGDGDWAPSTRYTVLTAQGGVSGQFGAVSAHSAFLDPTLDYDANAVYLTLVRNDLAMDNLGGTPNQQATGAAVDKLGLGNPLFDEVLQLDAGQALSAFDALSGELHASTRGGLLRAGADAAGVALLREQEPITEDATLWIRGNGAQFDLGGDGNASTLEHRSQGVTLGFEQPLGTSLAAGLAVGRDTARQYVDLRGSRSEYTGTRGMAYLRGQWNGWGALLGAAYSRYQIDDWRDVAFAGMQSSITADHRAQARAAFAQFGYDLTMGRATLHPHVSASRHWLRSDGFSERGGAAALQVAAAEDTLTVVRAGLATRWDISGGQSDRATLDAALAWERRSGDLRPVSHHQFASGSSFAIAGNAIARDAAVFDAGISISPTPRSRVRLGVTAGSDDAVTRGASLTWSVSL